MREWFIVGSKLLGIYFLYWALTSLPSSFMLASSLFSESVIIDRGPSNIVIFLAATLSNVVMIAFAIVLLFKTDLLADKLNIPMGSIVNGRKQDKLEPGIILIGIYLFCTKIGVLSEVFVTNIRESNAGNPFAATQPQGLTWSSKYIAPGVTVIAALLMIVGAKYITAFLTRKKRLTEQQAPLDRE
jgi:hypothetical protein